MVGAWFLGLVGCAAGPPFPAELEQRLSVNGENFCNYTIGGRTEMFVDFNPHLRVYRAEDVPETGCDELWLEADNPAYGACGRVTGDGATWAAELSDPPYPGMVGVDPAFTSSETGLGIWSIDEAVTFTGRLTYYRDERRLLMDVEGSGIESDTGASGTVHCVYEAIIPP